MLIDGEQKRRVLARAKWHDVKFLLRKMCGVEPDNNFVQLIEWGDDRGWLVQFSCDVDLADIKRSIFGVCILGERAVYIGICDA